MAKKIAVQYNHMKIPILGFVPESASSAPASPVAGQLWLDTSLTPARLKVYENGGWVLASQTGALLTTQLGVANGVASLNASTLIPIAQIPTGTTAGTIALADDARITGAQQTSAKGAANGYASLDAATRLPVAQLPTNLPASGLTGATAVSRYVGATASGAPSTGTFAVGDFVIDQTGNIFICTVAGSPGTWVAVLRFGTTSTTALAGNTPVELTTNKGAASGYASLDSATRLPVAQLPTNIPASGLTGATAASRYVGATASGAPASGTFVTGDFVIDQTGNLFVCTAGGTPGTWIAIFRLGTTSTTALAGNTPVELTTNKGATNGYASLVSGTVPIGQIPVSTSSVATAVVRADDARLSDTRTPSAASITAAMFAVGGIDQAAGTASARTLGYTGNAAMPGIARLDQIAAPTASVSLNSQKITNLLDGVALSDAINLGQLQASMAGIKGIKNPVRVAVSTNVTVASPGATLDGVAMVSGDRVLLYGQSTGTQNGIYVWNGAATPMTRATDADATGEVVDGTVTVVAEGTNQAKQMMQTATESGSPGAWTQVWAISNVSGTAYSNGNGLDLTGATFSVKKDTTDATNPLTVTSNGVGIGTIPIDHGGTGAITAPLARTALGAAGKWVSAAYTTAIVAGTPITFTHGLNTQDVVVSVRNTATNEHEDFLVIANAVNTITLTSDIAIASPSYVVTVIG